MADKPDLPRQHPEEGSREIVERELKRLGDGKERWNRAGPHARPKAQAAGRNAALT